MSQNIETSIELKPDEPLNVDTLKSQISKMDDFKKKCFYAKFDEREFKFIQSISSDEYVMYSFIPCGDFIKDIVNPENVNHKYNIAMNDKGIPIHLNDYHRIITESTHKEALAEYNHLLNSHHNRLVYNDSKSNIVYSNQNYKKSINYYLSHPSKPHLSHYDEFALNFIDTAANLRRHSVGIQYISDSQPIELDIYNKKNIDERIKVFKLPREISNIINNISYYFKDVKKDLKFNERTGYYELSYSSESIPIVCKHIYMILNGESLYSVNNECSVNNICKYCGDTLDNTEFEDTTTLPRSVAEYVYLLLSAYGCGSDDQSTFIYVYNGVASLISKLVKNSDPNFDNKATGVVALICWNVLKCYPPKSKSNSFVMMISETLASVGFNENKVQTIIDSGILGDPKNIYNALISTHDSSMYNMNSIFNEYSTDEIKHVKENGQIELFNRLYKKLRIENLNVDEIITDIHMKNIEMKKDIIEPTRYNTLMVFEGYIKKSCIENNKLHEFKNSKCVNCGIHQNYDNINEIYEKYSDKFNGVYNLEIETKFKSPTIQKINIDNVLKGDPEISKKEIIKHFNISVNEFDELKANMMINLAIIIPTINTWTHLEKYDWTIDELLNVIVYLNNDDVYSLLSWEVDMSKNVVMNGEDAENDDDSDDE
jgi:hypothetical protein